jgi:hypothetical protein
MLGTRPALCRRTGRQADLPDCLLAYHTSSFPVIMTNWTAHTKKRKREPRHRATQSPSHFFIGRQRDPPYVWAYDEDEMRASNMMWLVEEVIDGKELEKVYFEETMDLSRGLGVGRKKRRGNQRRVLDGGIIDMSISDGDEDDDDGALRTYIQSQPNSVPQDSSQLSIGSRSTPSSLANSSLESTLTTPSLYSRRYTPPKMRLAVHTKDKAKVLERRAVFVSHIDNLEAS